MLSLRLTLSGCSIVAALVGASAAQALTPQDWAAADAATVRLKPSAFNQLSAQIRQDLERRGCLVPQDQYSSKPPHNVIRGRFTSKAQVDTAVLCSKQRVSTILVFRGGSISAVAELARQPDSTFLQGVGEGRIAYSRVLNVADAKYIQVHYERYGGTKPPPLDHEGIDDGFDGKASMVWYWYRGRWLQLTGAD